MCPLAYKIQLSIDSCTQEKECFSYSGFCNTFILKKVATFYFSHFLFSMVKEVDRKNADFQKWINETLKALNMSSVAMALNEGK